MVAVGVNPEPGVAVRFTVRTDVSVGPALPDTTAPESLRAEWMKVRRADKEAKAESPDGGPAADSGFFGLPQKRRETGLPARLLEACGPVDFSSSDESAGCVGDASEAKRPTVVNSNFTKHNMLAVAVRRAFYEHYPLRLSPDVIWLTIVQGLAEHVQCDPEKHRASFDIKFEGKMELVVERPGFVKGSPDNDWTTVFPKFTEKIGGFIGEKLLTSLSCNFSTTDAVAKICSEIAIMDCVQSYFEYVMFCGCGIPSIELTGTCGDWRSVREKAEALLTRFEGLDTWCGELLPLLDQFCSAANGKPDLAFWNSICNVHGASGIWGGFTTGWLQILFPYLQGGRKNDAIGQWRQNYQVALGRGAGDVDELGKMNAQKGSKEAREAEGWRGFANYPPAGEAVDWKDFPTSISQAPVLYVDLLANTNYNMTFNGGIVAVVQHPETMALEPVLSWAVLDHGEAKSEANERG